MDGSEPVSGFESSCSVDLGRVVSCDWALATFDDRAKAESGGFVCCTHETGDQGNAKSRRRVQETKEREGLRDG